MHNGNDDSINVEKFNDSMVVIGKGLVWSSYDRQSVCEEKVECKAFRYWVNNDSYWTEKERAIKVDMQRLLKDIEWH